ncbi:copper resistance CopC family protein [Sphaerisporangium sp. NPDC005289]|uniref:copper resistance CopC family protein n=1 Tax=Sphaerisporangium sp. NPDC005289 TaxID=3155247 RepID=UPI0033A1528A
MRRLLTVLAVAFAALAVAVAPALAHNVLTGSDPKDGARLASLPAQVTLTFDQPVRADFAQVALTGPDGRVAKAAVHVVDAKVTAEVPASVAAGAAGAYVIGYQIVSNDGHPVTGKIGFTVAGTGSAAPVSPSTTPSTGPAGPGGTTPATGSGGAGEPPTPSGVAGQAPPAAQPIAGAAAPGTSGGGWVWGLLVAALLLSGLGILVVARQSRPAPGGDA